MTADRVALVGPSGDPASHGERTLPVIAVDELVLRAFDDGDAPAFAAAVRESLDTLGPWMPWSHPGYSEQDALEWFAIARAGAQAGSACEFGIFDTAGEFVGGIGLNLVNRQHALCNLGYWIRRSMQRQGIATRCIGAVARFGFDELKLHRIEIVVAVGNDPSEGVARKAGALFEHVARNRLLIGGGPVPASVFSLVPSSEGPSHDAGQAGWNADGAREWIGRTETSYDVVATTEVEAMAATLDNGAPVPGLGEPLPPLWHWLSFTPRPRRSELGPDGHAARGGFLPPVPLPRRMWAGGRLRWHDPLRVGDAMTRVSRVDDVTTKHGRTGPLVFVLVRHTISTDRGLALVEEHDIVYRDVPLPGSVVPAAPIAPTDEAWSDRVVPDDVLLFRYSALTFNGHRIHYDRRYVTEVEGYPGLVVHGPLIATLLLESLRVHRPDAPVARFEFRAIGPLFDLDPFDVCGRPSEDGTHVALWARGRGGALAMQATATLA